MSARRETNPAAVVVVSADMVTGTGFLVYACGLAERGHLRCVAVDECHLTLTASIWRAGIAKREGRRAVTAAPLGKARRANTLTSRDLELEKAPTPLSSTESQGRKAQVNSKSTARTGHAKRAVSKTLWGSAPKADLLPKDSASTY